jgi:hypothetical protein
MKHSSVSIFFEAGQRVLSGLPRSLEFIQNWIEISRTKINFFGISHIKSDELCAMGGEP